MNHALADPIVRWVVQSLGATFIFGIFAWIAIRVTRRASVRLAVAACGLGCCLAIPLLSWMVMQSGQSLTQIEVPAPMLTPQSAPEAPIQDSIMLPAGTLVEMVEVPGEPFLPPAPAEIPWPNLGLGVYVVGLGWGLVRLGVGLVRIQVILRDSHAGPDLIGFARVRTSGRVIQPFVCGLVRPTLVLPTDLSSRLHPREFEQVVAHEREHVRGHHAWIGALHRLATLVLWPQPMVHVLARELKAAQEEVCDNAALQGGSPSDYARMLVDLAAGRPDRIPSGLAYSIFGSQPPLEKRIRGILDPRRRTEPTMKNTTRTAVFGTALSLTMLLAGIQLVTAQEQVREVIGVPIRTDQAIEVQGYPIATPVEGVRVRAVKPGKQAKATKASKATKRAKAAAPVSKADTIVVEGYRVMPSDQSPLNKIEYKKVPITSRGRYSVASPAVKVQGVPLLKDLPVIGQLYRSGKAMTVPQSEAIYRAVAPKISTTTIQDVTPLYRLATPKIDTTDIKPLTAEPRSLAGGAQIISPGEPARVDDRRAMAPSQPAAIAAPAMSASAPSAAAIAPARVAKAAANRKPISVLKGATVILYSDGTTEIRPAPAPKAAKKPAKSKPAKRGK